jgi:hypothetical protein
MGLVVTAAAFAKRRCKRSFVPDSAVFFVSSGSVSPHGWLADHLLARRPSNHNSSINSWILPFLQNMVVLLLF